jgi:hypothetical protein
MGWVKTLFVFKGREVLHGSNNGRYPCPEIHHNWHARSSLQFSAIDLPAWAEQGIIGRGILIDYYSWAQDNAPYNPLTTHPITLENLKKVIAAQNLVLRPADILFIRSGFIHAYSKIDTPGREKIASVNPPHFAGVEQSEAVLEWMWNNQFAAVAGDAPSFEAWRMFPTG